MILLLRAISICTMLIVFSALSGCTQSTAVELSKTWQQQGTSTEPTHADAIQLTAIRQASFIPGEDYYRGKTDLVWLGDAWISQPYEEAEIRKFGAVIGADNVTVIMPAKANLFFDPPWRVRDVVVRFDRKAR